MYRAIVDILISRNEWIPEVSVETVGAKKVVLKYRNHTKLIEDKDILKWISNRREDILSIPDAIFLSVVGTAPEYMPSLCPRDDASLVDLVYSSILALYLGVVSVAWKIQGMIWLRRSELPEHWKALGGLKIIDSNTPVLKWDGTMSEYTLEDFNGMYTPEFLGYCNTRVVLVTDVQYPDMYNDLASDPGFQARMFGVEPSKISELSVAICSFLCTNKWDNALRIGGRQFIEKYGHLVPVRDLVPVLKSFDPVFVRDTLQYMDMAQFLYKSTLSERSHVIHAMGPYLSDIVDKIISEYEPTSIEVSRNWDLYKHSPNIKEKYGTLLCSLLSTEKKHRASLLGKSSSAEIIGLAGDLGVTVYLDENEELLLDETITEILDVL